MPKKPPPPKPAVVVDIVGAVVGNWIDAQRKGFIKQQEMYEFEEGGGTMEGYPHQWEEDWKNYLEWQKPMQVRKEVSNVGPILGKALDAAIAAAKPPPPPPSFFLPRGGK